MRARQSLGLQQLLLLGLGGLVTTTAASLVHLLLVVDVADHAWVHLRGLLRRIVQKCSVGELLRMLLGEVLV